MIEFISHEYFPDDQYTKELVYIQVNGMRLGYVAKTAKNGSIFWDEISCGVTVNGEKKYFKAFKFDSQFLRDDILAFLKARSWENKSMSTYMRPDNSNAYPPLQPCIATGSAIKGPAVIGQPQYEQTSFLDVGEPPF